MDKGLGHRGLLVRQIYVRIMLLRLKCGPRPYFVKFRRFVTGERLLFEEVFSLFSRGRGGYDYWPTERDKAGGRTLLLLLHSGEHL